VGIDLFRVFNLPVVLENLRFFGLQFREYIFFYQNLVGEACFIEQFRPFFSDLTDRLMCSLTCIFGGVASFDSSILLGFAFG
jgi:hypothetical protein